MHFWALSPCLLWYQQISWRLPEDERDCRLELDLLRLRERSLLRFATLMVRFSTWSVNLATKLQRSAVPEGVVFVAMTGGLTVDTDGIAGVTSTILSAIVARPSMSTESPEAASISWIFVGSRCKNNCFKILPSNFWSPRS